MKKTVYLTLGLAVLWFLIKIIFYMLGNSEMGHTIGVYSNLLFILIIVAFVLWRKNKTPDGSQINILSDIKDSSKSALLYVIVMSAFMAGYYSFVDADFLPNRKNKLIETEVQKVKTPESYKKVQANDLNLKDVSSEEYIANIIENANEQYSVKRNVLGGFMMLTITSFIYSVLLSFLFRNFLFK